MALGYTVSSGPPLGDTLVALTNLPQVKVHNPNAKVIVNELSKILDTPTVDLWYKCNAITCNVTTPKSDVTRTIEKKQCSQLDTKTVKLILPKESGSFTLSFSLDAASGIISLITVGIAGITVAAKVEVSYKVALVEYKLIFRTNCSPPKCESDSGEIAIQLHCTIGISAEIDATIDLGFGLKVSTSSLTAKDIITESWNRPNPVVNLPFHC